METVKVFLLDWEQEEHVVGEQLQEVLRSSADPQFEITVQDIGERDALASAGVLLARACANMFALNFLALDRVPPPEVADTLLHAKHGACPEQPTIAVVPANSPHAITDLFHYGATDVWVAPVRPAEALGRAAHWVELFPLGRPGTLEQLKVRLGLEQFIGESPVLMEEIQRLPVIARGSTTVLVRGETGTGKEICARCLHYLSPRSGKPFIAVNCGALPAELIENELFGHASGAFTSANSAAAGLVEQADGGTLFLDEIDSLSLSAQVKLLRFLQDKEYRPLGSKQTRKADLRIVAASNADLERLVEMGQFRQDLLYRLNVVDLTMPPLRERGGDVELLARHFLRRCAAEQGIGVLTFSPEAVRLLELHRWPGNVRELENVVERAVLRARQPVVHAADIGLRHRQSEDKSAPFKSLKAEAVRAFERDSLVRLLQANNGNISGAARAAGKHRRAFWELLRKHGLTARRSSVSRH